MHDRQTVEEADDVGEVHVVVDDDLAVVLDERERDEQLQVRRGHVLRRPDRLPDREHVLVHQLCTPPTAPATHTNSPSIYGHGTG